MVNSTRFDADQGSYFVDASGLVDFVKAFHVRVRDYFMWADVIVVSPAGGFVIYVQHDGCIVKFRGSPVTVVTVGGRDT